MTKAEQRKFDKLTALLIAETERAEKAWASYRDTLHELVEVKMRLKAVEEALRGDGP